MPEEIEDMIDIYKINLDSNLRLSQVEKEMALFLDKYYTGDTDFLFIGIHEMISNAVEHGNKLDPAKTVSIKIIIRKEIIKVEIVDQGSGFDWQNTLSKFDKAANQELNQLYSERGRGIFLAKQTFDEIKYNKQGNKAILIKNRMHK